MFKKATKLKSSPKILLLGASGSGKTWTSLEIAHGLTNNWEDVYVIDTEASAAKYANSSKEFMVAELETHELDGFISAIQSADGAGRCIIIDSITHLWSGVGGLLSAQKDLENTPRYRNAPMGSWSEINTRLASFFLEVRKCKAAVIVTCRTKDRLIRQEGSRGYIKVSDAIMFREGYLDYEFDVAFMLESDHSATCYKDRTGIFDSMDPRVLDVNTAQIIKEWAATGVSDVQAIIKKDLRSAVEVAIDAGVLSSENAEKALAVPQDKMKKTLEYINKIIKK